MLTCRELAEEVSQGLERKPPLRMRLRLALHLAMCRGCRSFRRQMRALQALLAGSAAGPAAGAAPEPALPTEARQRIQAALDRAVPR